MRKVTRKLRRTQFREEEIFAAAFVLVLFMGLLEALRRHDLFWPSSNFFGIQNIKF